MNFTLARRFVVTAGLSLFIGTGIVGPLHAGPLYTVNITDPAQPTFGGTHQSATPGLLFLDSFNHDNPPFVNNGSGIARASQGRVGAAIVRDNNGIQGVPRELSAYATFFIDDLVFSSPTSTPINVTLPLHLSGALNQYTGSGLEHDTAIVSVEVTLSGQAKAGNLSNISGTTGLLTGLSPGTIDTTISASFTNVAVNTPTTLELSISTQLFVNGNRTPFSDFDQTFGFITGGPTFTVPAGVNVNSAQGAIVDNLFIIPEPSTYVIGLLGLMLFPCRTRQFEAH